MPRNVIPFPGRRRPQPPGPTTGGSAAQPAPALPVTEALAVELLDLAAKAGLHARLPRRSMGWTDARGRHIIVNGEPMTLRVASAAVCRTA